MALLDENFNVLTKSDLMVFLNSSQITYGMIDKVLKSKGIFIGENDKSVTVPILCSTILTYDDYDYLIETSISRELKEKIKISSLELKSANSNWHEPIRDKLIDENFDPLKKMSNVTFIDVPEVEIENENNLKIRYSIRREDYSKDILKRDLKFEGEVRVEREGALLKLNFANSHSSVETDKINIYISNKIGQILKSEDIVCSENFRKISYDSFNDNERVKFFKKLTDGFNKEVLLNEVKNIEITRTQEEIDENDLKISWMKDTVTTLKVDGVKLHSIFVISDENYYKYYNIKKMSVSYKFQLAQNKGEFKVQYFFSSDAENAELVFDLSGVQPENNMNHSNLQLIKAQLINIIKKLIEEKFNAIEAER